MRILYLAGALYTFCLRRMVPGQYPFIIRGLLSTTNKEDAPAKERTDYFEETHPWQSGMQGMGLLNIALKWMSREARFVRQNH
jgi:hypothetical protein